MKLVVVIPAYNEHKSVGEVIRRVPRDVCDEVKIVVIDDGSTDETAEVARSAGAHVIRHHRRLGITACLKTGISFASSVNADIIVTIDADGQYLPKEISKLIQPLRMGEADLVLGSRFIGHIEKMSWVKRFGNRVFTWLMRRLTGFPFTDTQTGFRAFTRDFSESIVLRARYTYTQEMLINAVERGFRIKEVPIRFSKRKYGESRLIANPLFYAIKSLMIILRTYRDYHPMKFFGVLGGLLVAIGTAIGAYLLAFWLVHSYIGRMPTLILSVLLIILGSESLLFGFFADMLITQREELRVLIERIRKREET